MYLVFDIGASKMRFALSRDRRAFHPPKVEPTPSTGPAVLAAAKRIIDELTGCRAIASAAGGLTRKWGELAADLPHLLGCPLFLENDSALVGLGESVAGAGRPEGVMAYLTISTGVGGARIVDGRIDRYAVGFEPGHQIINFQEPARVWEDYISGRAVLASAGRAPNTVHEPNFWAKIDELTAYGLYNTILHWSPDLVVIGGSMLKQPGINLAAVAKRLQKINKILPTLPPLVPATLGDFGGLHGGLALLRQKIS